MEVSSNSALNSLNASSINFNRRPKDLVQKLLKLQKEFEEIELLKESETDGEYIRRKVNFLIKLHYKHVLYRKEVRDLFGSGNPEVIKDFLSYAIRFGFHLSSREWLYYFQMVALTQREQRLQHTTFFEALAQDILYRIPMITYKISRNNANELSQLFTLEQIRRYRQGENPFPGRINVFNIVKMSKAGSELVTKYPPKQKVLMMEPGADRKAISRGTRKVLEYDKFIDYAKQLEANSRILPTKQNLVTIFITFDWFQSTIFNHGLRITPEFADIVVCDKPPPRSASGYYVKNELPDVAYVAHTIVAKPSSPGWPIRIENNKITLNSITKLVRVTGDYIKLLIPKELTNKTLRKIGINHSLLLNYQKLFMVGKMQLNEAECKNLMPK